MRIILISTAIILTAASGLGGFEIDCESAIDKAWDEFSDILENLWNMNPKPCDINVRLFSVKDDGVTYGLIYEEVEEEYCEYVMLEPNDIMFHKPWNSGEYST